LYLGKRDGKDLVYMGKVGTGWSRTASSQIRRQLDTVVSPKSKLSRPIKKPKATWVEPTFVADIEYRDVTSEGLLRASSLSKGTDRRKTSWGRFFSRPGTLGGTCRKRKPDSSSRRKFLSP